MSDYLAIRFTKRGCLPPRERRTGRAVRTPDPTPLTLVADVSARLAGGADLASVLPDVAGTVRDALGARHCGIWRERDGQWMLLAGVGDGELPHDPPAPASGRRRGWVSVPIGGDHRPLGMLGVLAATAPTSDERLALSTVANLLSCAILAADEAHRWADEREAGTRELEAQHRFIERIVDSLPVGLYVVDREYRVHAWNRKRETGTQGVLREEALGR